MKKQLFPTVVRVFLALASASVAVADPVLDSVTVGAQSPSSINAGSNAAYTVTVARTGLEDLDAYLTCSGLPSGATASFSPSFVHFAENTTTSRTSTLTISTTASTPTGVYTFTVTARGGDSSITRTNTGTLTIGSDGKTSLSPHTITSIRYLADHTASLALQGAANHAARFYRTAASN